MAGDYIIANCSSPSGTNKLCTATNTCNTCMIIQLAYTVKLMFIWLHKQ